VGAGESGQRADRLPIAVVGNLNFSCYAMVDGSGQLSKKKTDGKGVQKGKCERIPGRGDPELNSPRMLPEERVFSEERGETTLLHSWGPLEILRMQIDWGRDGGLLGLPGIWGLPI